MLDDIAILIPAYQPDDKLTAFIAELRGAFAHIVVVDDGSTEGRAALDAVRPQVDAVLAHARNCGKGAALKTGFAWIEANLPQVKGVVTADADGQHRPADVRRIAEAVRNYPNGLVLGVRAFVGKVPFRSLLGNFWARVLFWILTGLAIRDTQTGLRGIPRGLLARLRTLKGARYDYEMRMLVDARRHPAKPRQIPIETVYIDDNKSSHFRPLRDTLRTQHALWSARFGR